jgi:AmmeMemoRadiSam system protein A
VLTDDQRRALLDLARTAIESAVTGLGAVDPGHHVGLPAASGVFVTIKRAGRLRGCLGTLQTRGSLAVEIARCAVDSAREDPRFPPVAPGELPELALEISILGALELIEPVPDRFILGVHGLVAEHEGRRGLLLPQVAIEWGWTPEQFLRQTCVKAGLAEDAWQRGATIYRFAAEVFGD